jgi:hypothetical protein
MLSFAKITAFYADPYDWLLFFDKIRCVYCIIDLFAVCLGLKAASIQKKRPLVTGGAALIVGTSSGFKRFFYTKSFLIDG